MAEALDAEWFLVANKDKLSIKIRGQVTLGEDDRGLLTLESRKDTERWFTLSVDNQDALVVSELGAAWEMESPGAWVSQQPGIVCIPGTLLSLPNNEVYISHNLLRGKVQQQLVVRPAQDQADNPEVDIVVPEPPLELDEELDDQTQLEKAQTRPETEATEAEELLITALPPGSPIEVKEQTPAQLKADIPTLTTPAVANDTVAEIPQENAVAPRKSKAAYAGFVLLGLAGAASYFFWQVDTSVSMPMESAQVTTPVEELEVTTEVEPKLDEIPEIVAVEPITEVAPEPETSPAIVEVVAEDWQKEIAEARFLMERGFINYPERNAVSILGEVLAASPDNVEAWQLLNQATDIYLSDARRAHEDGFINAALEMLDEVERFHPNYERLAQIRTELSQINSD